MPLDCPTRTCPLVGAVEFPVPPRFGKMTCADTIIGTKNAATMIVAMYEVFIPPLYRTSLQVVSVTSEKVSCLCELKSEPGYLFKFMSVDVVLGLPTKKAFERWMVANTLNRLHNGIYRRARSVDILKSINVVADG